MPAVTRRSIPIAELTVAAWSVWDKTWFALTAGEFAPGRFNTMTVSWGGLGCMWGRPFAMVVVRPQRYTREFIDRCDTFSLCAFAPQYRPALDLLGTKSGRDSTKMADCGLTPIALERIACPGFAEADLILECRKIYADDLNPSGFLAEYIASTYHNDYHRMYFGEILAVQGIAAYRRP